MSRKKTASEARLEASISKRIEQLKAALGDPFHEDPRLDYYATSLQETEEQKAGASVRRPSMPLLEKVDAFLAAQEIALPIINRWFERNGWDSLAYRAAALRDIELIRMGRVRTLSQLRYLESAFLTPWNEGPWIETCEFWKAVRQAGLPYIRRDLLAEIFERGRITTREHFDFATDIIGGAEAEGLLDSQQVHRLSEMIGAYERSGCRS